MSETTPEPTKTRSPITWVPTLYFAEGMPFYVVALVAGLMYKSMGVANDQIAKWTGILGFAWVFKCLWSPFLELVKSKKSVVVTFEILGGVAMGLVALFLQTPMWFALTIGALALASLSAATHDIAADGTYIASLDAKQQAMYSGWQGAFFNAGKFISLGVLVMLAGNLEKSMGNPAQAWTIIFGIIGAIMVGLGLYHTWALPNSKNTAGGDASISGIWDTLKDVIVEFFKKPGIWVAMLFIVLFRAAEGQIQTIGPLFLRETKELGGLGLSTEQIGFAYGTVGTAAFIGGSILGGYFTSWLGLKKAMLWLILAMNLPNLAFFFLSQTMPSDMVTVSAALGFEMFGYGFGFCGVILFIMQVVAVGKYTTAHYALGTGVMQLGFVLFKMISGDIQMSLGYHNFFIYILFCTIPILVMSRFITLEGKAKEAPAA